MADIVPRAIATRRPYRELLAAAGCTGIASRDVTAAYLRTARDWLAQTRRHVEGLEAAFGPVEVEDLLTSRATTIEHIEAGHLRRWMYWADR